MRDTKKDELVNKLVKGGYLKTASLARAFKKIDRADFVAEDLKSEAYNDNPLSIGYGKTISQPLTVAFMLELLKPKEGEKILDIGSGSGWQTALLSEIVGEKGKVFGLEIIPELKEFGQKNIEKYGFISGGIAKILWMDGSKGLIAEAPFDGIIVGAMAGQIPKAFYDQLKVGGRLVAPQGGSVWLIIKKSADKFEKHEYPGFAFVPLIEE